MDPVFIGLGFLGLSATVVVGKAMSVHNMLMALDERCNTAFADIDVLLKHRHSVIPGLVETVRGFANHESHVLKAVTEARAKALSASAPEMRLEAEHQLGQSIHSLLNVVESYPALKADSHFHQLRNELVDVENRITASRRYYNATVDEFNATLRQFPGSLIGGFARLARRQHFELGMDRVLMDEPVSIRF